MKTVLVTGAAGQDASYLAELLLGKGYRVVGLVRNGTADLRFSNIAHIADQMELVAGDICDHRFMNWLIKSVMPDEIYNLAAMSFVKRSFEDPISTANTDGVAVVSMLEAIKRIRDERGHNIKFYQASTSEMFGGGEIGESMSEKTPFSARSPYAAAKLYAHQMVKIYREAYGLYAVSGILFNHESPRRGYEFVTRKISRGVARIKLGKESFLQLGNLDAVRDWGFAGDYVEAMWMMMGQDIYVEKLVAPKDYVVATNESHQVREFVDKAFKAVGLDWKKYVVQDDCNFRPLEVAALKGDYSRIHLDLGWAPKVEFDQLVKMMVEADLKLEKQ